MAPRAPRVVVVEARAKLNLGLAVGPRRADGFHELATIFQSVTLADTLVARRRPRGFTLRVRFEDASARRSGKKFTHEPVPVGPDNLVLEAARLLAADLGLEGGAAFELVKRIPAQAGLGGGSADAAAALRALAVLYGRRLSVQRGSRLAGLLGSDVPFALLGGTALGLGRGERLQRLRLARPFRVLVAVPEWRVSTREAFARIARRGYPLTSWARRRRFANEMGRNVVDVTRALRLGNTFEEVLGDRRSDFESLRARLMMAGAQAVRMTGSGSAVFAVLGPGISALEVAGRFAGSETLYLARSARAGMRLRTQP